MLREDLPVIVTGTLNVAEEELPKLRANKLRPVHDSAAAQEPQCLIILRAAKLKRRTMEQIQQLLLQHHGDCPVMFRYIGLDNEIKIRAGEKFFVAPSAQLTAQIEDLLGKNSVAAA